MKKLLFTLHCTGQLFKRNTDKWILIALFLTALMGIPRLCPAQNQKAENSLKKIESIFIVGNKHTDDHVIRRELLFEEGDVISDSILQVSKKRIENLMLFNRVDMKVTNNVSGHMLIISVTERLYLFPYPAVGLEDRDWDKITYGFGLAHDNFRGNNEKLYLLFLFGYRPGYEFAYSNPWVHRKLHLTFDINLYNYTSPNRIFDFNEKHFFTAFTIGKYWTRNFFTKVRFLRDRIQVDDAFAPFLQSGETSEQNYAVYMINRYDGRDLYAYPSRGWYTMMELRKNGFFHNDLDYWKAYLDLRHYLSIQSFIVAARLYSVQSMGDLPVYDGVYFGFDDRVRGHFNRVWSGNHSLLGSVELRFPILPVRYFTIPTKFIPQYLTKDLKFGINGGIFGESGQVWQDHESFKSDKFIHGYGFGLHFRVPYIEVLRLDLAFDENGNSQYVFETGLAF
ncbi:MAG: hypothetical protein GF313_04710 [Caldithrix sp.]|nr:hypothetical protein [Caldithrix sp.]